MNIAILGGSFDPPHVGHALVTVQIKELYPLDEVWFMPAHIHPFDKKILPVKHRLAMLGYFENEYTKISKFEIGKGNTCYTIDTLTQLTKLSPSDTFHWVLGADQLTEIKRWKDWEKLITTYNFIIFPRQPIAKITEAYVKRIFEFRSIRKNISIASAKKLILSNISSTLIRDRIKSKQSIQFMVPSGVEKYIKENKLYE